MPWYAYALSAASICAILAGIVLAAVCLRRLRSFWRAVLYAVALVSIGESGYLIGTGRAAAALVPGAVLLFLILVAVIRRLRISGIAAIAAATETGATVHRDGPVGAHECV